MEVGVRAAVDHATLAGMAGNAGMADMAGNAGEFREARSCAPARYLSTCHLPGAAPGSSAPENRVFGYGFARKNKISEKRSNIGPEIRRIGFGSTIFLKQSTIFLKTK